MRHGRGIFIGLDGSIYEGYWKFDKMSGFGRKVFIDGSVYEGDWLDGSQNGQGKHSLANGDTYLGEFKDNNYDGHGTQTLRSGQYIGNFRLGKKHNEGTFTWTDGSFYKGQFVND